MGKEFKDGIFEGVYGNAIYLPIPFIDNSNLEQVHAGTEGRPGHYSVSSSLTIEEAGQFFK
jgi:ribose transport system substrate-binding protein